MDRNNNVVLSVIIPHYNIPALLERCLKSVPVRDDVQVIVVDDCSPDASEYIPIIPDGTSPLTTNPYVEYYSTPIGGSAGRARNIGLDHARGKWLTFLDADDLLSEDVGSLLDKYKDRSEDILFFQTRAVMNDDLSKTSDRSCFTHHFEKYFEKGDDTWLRYYFDALWGKFINKALVDRYSIRFEEIQYGNDAFFSISAGTYANEVAAFKDVLYINTKRPGSLTSAKKKSLNEWHIRFDGELRIMEFLDVHGVRFQRFGFADSLLFLLRLSPRAFIKEFMRLSFRYKNRFFRFCARVLINKLKRIIVRHAA